MPTYFFRNRQTQDHFEIFMTISERDRFVDEHPELEQLINGSPALIEGIKLDTRRKLKGKDDFHNLLKRIKRSHKHSTMEVDHL